MEGRMADEPNIKKLNALADERDSLEAQGKLTGEKLDELEAAARNASCGMRDALVGYDAARGRLLERETTPLPRWVWGLAALIPALGFAWYLRTLFWAEWKDVPHWGALGDAVGPFAGLMSSAAVLIALYSIQLQRRELTMQREELRLQRREMADSREELAKAATAQQELADAQRRHTLALKIANDTARLGLSVQNSAIGASMDAAISATLLAPFNVPSDVYLEDAMKIAEGLAGELRHRRDQADRLVTELIDEVDAKVDARAKASKAGES